MLIYRLLTNPNKYIGKSFPNKWGFVKLDFGKPYAFRIMLGHSFIEIGTQMSGLWLPMKGEF